MLAQQGYIVAVGAPDDVLDGRGSELGQHLLLLDIKQDHRGGRCEDQRRSTAVKDVVGLDGTFDGLDDVVGKVSGLDVLGIYQLDIQIAYTLNSLPDQPCPALPICFERQRSHCIPNLSFHPRGHPCHPRR